MMKQLYLCVEPVKWPGFPPNERVRATLLPLLSLEWDLVEEAVRMRREEPRR